ncbi:hypothetical protein BH24GEM3_BH24GEM3_18510 [soil metagenome]|jgi:uncharacterized protein (TIGR02246 family)
MSTTQNQQVRQEIEAVVRRWMEAYRSGDAAQLSGLYTDDALLLPPDTDMVRGREAIQQVFGGIMASGVKEINLSIVEIESDGGQFAHEVGTAELVIRPEGQPEMRGTGKYVVIWKRAGDSWKLHVDIFNITAPPQ